MVCIDQIVFFNPCVFNVDKLGGMEVSLILLEEFAQASHNSQFKFQTRVCWELEIISSIWYFDEECHVSLLLTINL